MKYILSTGGAAGSFTCGTDAGMSTFIERWACSGLIGVDFDIEAGQSQAVIGALVQRIKTAHGTYPSLRFSLTLATLANNNGASTAQSLGSGAPDSFNVYGDGSLAAVQSTFGFNGSASSWPSYLTVDLMTMDYGSPSDGVCVVSGGACQMGQSALQAAYNLHDHWGVPFANIELTPMIGGNDARASSSPWPTPTPWRSSPSPRGSPASTTGRTTATTTAPPAPPRRPATRWAPRDRTASSSGSSATACTDGRCRH